jgi:RNA polymerase sigma-70 factor (ECF subfamily)
MNALYNANTSNETDGALVAATKWGDLQAFERLVERHQPRALAMAQRITRNREDAEDVVQESFHKAFRHLGDFEEKARFSTWLTRIVMNESYMLLRRRRTNMEVLPESSEDGMGYTPEAFVDVSLSPEESCWRNERRELLTKAVRQLRPAIREAVLLRDFEARSVKETAQILGTSTATVKARLFQARRKLLRTVKPDLLRDFTHSDGSRHRTAGA